MANIAGWITFKNLVDDIMLGQGDAADNGQFMRYLNFAIKGYLDLRTHTLESVKSVLCDISPEIRAIRFPDDLLKFNSVGVIGHNGEFCKFLPKRKKDITYVECGIDKRDGATGCGYYTLDRETGRILIDAPLDVQQVILNYTPTGVKTDGKTYIPRICEAVVKAYVEWQVALRDKVTGLDKQLFKQQYREELDKFIGLSFNTDALWEEYYRHIGNNYKY